MKNTLYTAIAVCTALVAYSGPITMPAIADETTTIITRHDHMRLPDTGDIRVMVNRQEIDFNGPGPIMVAGDHVMVPIRGVFEQMGGDVQWHQDSQEIMGASPGHMFQIRVGSNNGIVNGSQVDLPTAPLLIGGTTYVPLRFASEALGARVGWNSDNNTVWISTGEDHGGIDRMNNNDVSNDGGGDTTTIIKRTTTGN